MDIKKILLLFTSFIFVSCALYEPQYRSSEPLEDFPVNKEIEETFFLIGDAGKSPKGGLSEGLQVVQDYLKENPSTNDYAVFLGDNIYPDGMPLENDPDRKRAEYQLDAQINSLDGFNGTMYFIPGNHEWYNNGLRGVKRQEEYLRETSNGKELLQPSNGCPLTSVSVSETVQLIMIDSQWYLEDWNANPDINEYCEIKTREKFLIELELEFEKNQNKTILFTMHHPMFTNGTHGGYFALEKHLYITQKKIPLPVLSSLVTQIRAQGGVSIQDRYNERYNNFMVKLGSLAKKYGRIVFASGHEHTLQHHEKDGLIQILSGSGSKESAASLGKDALFTTGAQGFAIMTVFKDGSSWVRYFIKGENNKPKLVFQKELYPPNKIYKNIDEYTAYPEEIEISIDEQDSLKQALFFNTIWGGTYKEVYHTAVMAKVAVLDTLYGGMEVVRETGKKDYNTLRLRSRSGKFYRMRALKNNSLNYKRPLTFDSNTGENIEKGKTNEILIPDNFNADFYTASHPYAGMTIPRMAGAINIFYTQPELYYIPKQNTLGLYNENFGDALYFISLEPTEESYGERTFRYPVDVETTDDILIKLRKDKSLKVDEESYILSRLFDMLIGDWDREPDHWRWAEYTREGKNLFVPIPRNRDDAFASLDGNILNVAGALFGGTRVIHEYREDLSNLQWFNEEGILLDRALLQMSGRNQWNYAAHFIQSQLTDELIDAAFDDVPEEVQDESLARIKNTLKGRRNNLAEIANTYYDYLANLKTIIGTDSEDYFEITRLSGGSTNVKTYTYENGVLGDLITDKTLSRKNTRELWVYGLDGNDSFVINGEDNDPIYVRVIGGRGTDVFDINEGRSVKFYDYKEEKTIIPDQNHGKLIFTNLYNLNTYDYRKNINSEYRYAPALGYNPDDGFNVGLQFEYTVKSFQQNPFAKRHAVQGGYYFDTQSFDIEYNGEFANSIGDSNLSIGLRLTSPNYTVNYFGYGNESVNAEDLVNNDFNRVELQNNTAKIGLIRNASFGSVFRLFLKADSFRLAESLNPLYQDKGNVTIEETKYFGTLEGAYDYRSFDNPLNPKRGMVFNLTAGVTDNMEDFSRVFGYLKSKLTFYNAIVKSERFVLKTNVQAQFNFGNQFEFYQGVQIGANSGLRGFREERFTGKSSLSGSADLRYSFNEFNIALFPVQMGVFAGVDLGRVWTPSGNSERWHNSRGGGFWINSSGGLGATFSAFNSAEGTRFIFGLGFNF
ncbi:MAG: hypothetical protein ACJAX3_000370 [Patiriisocius sp.]|jgi:hypothetical protein